MQFEMRLEALLAEMQKSIQKKTKNAPHTKVGVWQVFNATQTHQKTGS